MKLLVVLSIKESQERVAELLHQSGIRRFSVADITGYKNKEESLGWFAANASTAKTNSMMLFCFTEKETADKAISAIDSCNIGTKNLFPVHAFVLDVESFSKLI